MNKLAATVDRLAIVKRDISELQAEEAQLKATLAAAGLPAIDGSQHRATIVHSTGRTATDWHAVAEHFKPSRQLITAHTTQGAPFVSVRMTARQTH